MFDAFKNASGGLDYSAILSWLFSGLSVMTLTVATGFSLASSHRNYTFIDSPTYSAHVFEREQPQKNIKYTKYFISYTYVVDGVRHENRDEVSHDLYAQTQTERTIEVHVDPIDHSASNAEPRDDMYTNAMASVFFSVLLIFFIFRFVFVGKTHPRADSPTRS